MNNAIEKALKQTIKDGFTRYVYSTYVKIVTSFEPAPFKRHCWQVNPDGNVIEIKEVY